jgi:hypothetical protein
MYGNFMRSEIAKLIINPFTIVWWEITSINTLFIYSNRDVYIVYAVNYYIVQLLYRHHD